MKLNLWKSAVVGGVLLGGLAATTAGTLQTRDVAGNSAWLIHLDCDALKKTEFGKFILDEIAKPETKQRFDKIQADFGVDLRKQLHGLTAYSSSKSKEDGVLLIYADFDPNTLINVVEKTKEHESTSRGKNTIHSWLDEKKAAKEGGNPRTYAAIHDGKLLIISGKEGPVAGALDVLDGAKPNLAQSKSVSRLGSANSSFLVGVAWKLDLPNFDPAAAVFKESKVFWLSAGEANGKVDITLSLETADEETARQIESVGKGLVGLLGLQKDKTNSVKLSQGLSVEQSKSDVIAKLSLPSADIMGMIKASPKKKDDN
jgi:hypothetical protein